jgi:hypothetical protein
MKIALPLVAAAIVFAGCASEVARTQVRLDAAAGERPRIALAKETTVYSSSGYSRVLPAGSRWELRGTLPQGKVYKRLEGIFTVEGAHVHEAFLVVSENKVVGYYLPVEQAFSPAEAVSLSLKQER